VTKLVRPELTREAARAVGLPASCVAVRVFGAIECVIAVAGALIGGIAALGVAGMFVVLAVIAGRLLRRAPSTPCGCLGARATPVSPGHVVVDGLAAASALLAAFGVSPLSELGAQPLAGVPFVVLVLCAARLAALLMEARTEGAR
jgi:hypothetical protein